MSKISAPFEFKQGDSPLLVSMPHSGLALLEGMAQRLTTQAQSLPDTDWHIPQLYDFLDDIQASVISANYSRYVVDLNRPVDDKPLYSSKTTGLFPNILFADQAVFQQGQEHSSELKKQIKKEIWQPYHDQIGQELARIKEKFGYAILFDAHSIAARVPMLFEGDLPDFNFGNNENTSCAALLLETAASVISPTQYTYVNNGRFKGGFITRSFGDPKCDIHAIQLELSQATYLDTKTNDYLLDPDKKQQISPLLRQLIRSILAAADSIYGSQQAKEVYNDRQQF